MKSKLKSLVLILGGGFIALAFVGIPVRSGTGEPVSIA